MSTTESTDTPRRSSSMLIMAAVLALLAIVAAVLLLRGFGRVDPAKAAKTVNDKAVSALESVGPNATVEQTLIALNQIAVPFAAGSAELPAAAEPALVLAALKIAALPPGAKLDVVGFTEGPPKSEADFKLALARAASVVDFLQRHGAGEGRLRPLGSSAPQQAAKGAPAGPTLSFRVAS